jgi:hypothetical protein
MIAHTEMQEIAETAAALIPCADLDSFAALIISPIYDSGKRAKHYDAAILPGLRAIRGELLVLYDGFSRDETERLECFKLFVRLLQPLLEGVAKVRFVRHEALDRLIVLPLEPNDGLVSFSHVGSSSTPESVLPFA